MADVETKNDIQADDSSTPKNVANSNDIDKMNVDTKKSHDVAIAGHASEPRGVGAYIS